MELNNFKIIVNGVEFKLVMAPRILDPDVRSSIPASSAWMKKESFESEIVTASDSEVTYVNPKQYHRILKRREARTRLINTGRIPEHGKRSKYLHESRHLQALKRGRDADGRFFSRSSRLNGSISSESSQDSQISVENEGQVSPDH